MVAGGVLLFLGQSTVRAVEARIAALLLGGVQLAQASTLDTNVLFRLRGAFVGLNVTASCSAALLVSPFCLFAGGLVVTRRTSIRGGLATLGILALWLFGVNQLRILFIVLSMHLWGFQQGYEFSHVALGSVISTLAVLGGVLLFIHSAARSQPPLELRG